MDSVLTYLVEDSMDVRSEFNKNSKKYFKKEYSHLFRDVEQSFRSILESLDHRVGEIVISALSPYSFYNIIKQCGFTPRVIDVNLDTALPDIEDISKAINKDTIFIVNTFTYTVKPITESVKELGIPVIDIFLCGVGANREKNTIPYLGDYSIISLESNNILSSLGGALLLYNSENKRLDSLLDLRPELLLSGLNTAFALTLFQDLDEFFCRREPIIEIYKNSILKSGYYTFENGDTNGYSLFPIVIKKSIKDIQIYCKNLGLETKKGFTNSIVKQITGIKCSNARALTLRTLLIPLSFSMKKSSIELISKILSTLP